MIVGRAPAVVSSESCNNIKPENRSADTVPCSIS